MSLIIGNASDSSPTNDISQPNQANQPSEANNYLYSLSEEELSPSQPAKYEYNKNDTFMPEVQKQEALNDLSEKVVSESKEPKYRTTNRAEQKRSVLPAIFASEGLTITSVAQSRHLSRELMLTPEIIQQNLEKAKTMARAKRLEDSANKSVAEWVAKDKENAAIHRDDEESINKLAGALLPENYKDVDIFGSTTKEDLKLPKSVRRFLGGAERSVYDTAGLMTASAAEFEKGRRNLLLNQVVGRVEDLFTGGIVKSKPYDPKIDENLKAFYQVEDKFFSLSNEVTQNLNSGDLALAPELQAKPWDKPSVMLEPEWWGKIVPETAGGIAPALTAGAASGSGWLASVLMAASEGGSTTKEALEGGATHSAATLAGLSQFAATALLERAGLGGLFEPSGILKKGVKTVLKEFIKTGVKEGATEYTEGLSQSINLSLALGENLEQASTRFLNKAKEIESAVVGFAFGSTMQGIHQSSSQYNQIKQSQIEEALANTNERLNGLDEAAISSKTRDLMPEKYQELVEQAAKDSDIKEVFIDAETFFQSDVASNTQLREKLGIDDNAAYTALALGNPIKVPLAVYQTYIAGTDVATQLREGIKFKEDNYNTKESKAFAEHEAQKVLNLSQEYKELNDNLESERKRIRLELKSAAKKSSNLRTEAASKEGGLDAYINDYLKAHEPAFARLGGGSVEGTIAQFKKLKIQSGSAFVTAKEASNHLKNQESLHQLADDNIALYQEEDPSLPPALLSETLKKVEEQSQKEQQALDYGQRVKEASKKWAAQVKAFFAGNINKREIMQLGETPDLLQSLGLPKLPLVMEQSIAKKITGQKKNKQDAEHNLSEAQVGSLVEELADPVMVLKAENGYFIAVTTQLVNDAPVIVAIEPHAEQERIKVNDVRSAYGKNGFNGWLIGQAKKGNLIYTNKKKSDILFKDRSQLQLPRVLELQRSSSNKVISDNDIVKPLYQEELYQDAAGKPTGKPPRGSLTLGADGYTITLNENANISTLFHETAHYFLLETQHMVEQGLADESLNADFKTILKYLGVKDNKITREQHENFARALEAYLIEGKAPTPALTTVFGRFKRWLTSIYKDTLKLQVPLNAEIRAVFDRFYANELEIKQAAYDNELMGLTSKHLDALNLSAEKRDFANGLMEKAIEKAVEKRHSNITKNRKARLKAWAEEAQEELEKDGVYKLRKDLGKKDFEGRGQSLDSEMLEALFGAELVEQLRKSLKTGSLKKGGANPSTTAKKYKYSDVDAMVADLLEAESLGSRVKKIVAFKDAMFEKQNIDSEALLLEQEEIGTQFAFIGRYVAELSGNEHIEQAKINDAAELKMQAMPLKEAMSHKSFLNAMRFARRRELLAIAKGDWKTAYQAGVQVRFNLAFAKHALEYKNNIEGFVKSTNSYINNKKADPNARYMVMALGARYGINKINMRLADGRSHKTFVEWIAEKKEQGYELLVDDNIMYNEGQELNSLTVAEYQALKEQLGQIMVIEENLRTINTEQGKIDLEELATAISSNLRAKNKLRKHHLIAKDPWLRSMIERGHYSIAKIETTIIQMEGESQGLLHQHLYQKVSNGADQKSLRVVKAQEQLVDIYNKHFTQDELNKMSSKNIAITGLSGSLDGNGIKNKIKGFVSLNGKDVLHSKENLLCVALNMGNQINISRLLESGLTQENLTAITNKLEKRDWEFCQDIWDFLESFREESFALEERTRGLRPQAVEARAVETKHGTFRGGYYPIAYDVAKSESSRQFNEKDLMKDEFGGTHTQTKQGHLKQRAGVGLGTPLIFNFGVLSSHTYNVIHDITMREAILDAAKILRHKEVSSALSQVLGAKGHGIFMPWLKDIAREKKEASTMADSSMSWLRTRTTKFVLGYKLGTVIQQVTGVAVATDSVGAKNMALGFKKVYGDAALAPLDCVKHIKDLWAETKELSPFMAGRLNSFDRDIKDAASFLELEKGAVKWTQKHALSAIGFAQLGVDLVVFYGALEQGLSLYNGDTKKAVAHAEQTVRLTQGSGKVADLSEIQRGSELSKLMTMFYSYFNMMYNLTALKYTEIKRTETTRAKAEMAAKFVFWVKIMPTALSMAFMAMKGKEMPEDEESWLKYICSTYLEQEIGMLPVAKDLYAGFASGYDYQLSPVVGSVKMLFNAVKAPFKEEKKGKNAKAKEVVTGAIRSTGFVTGIASELVARLIQDIWNYQDGTTPELELRKTILR